MCTVGDNLFLLYLTVCKLYNIINIFSVYFQFANYRPVPRAIRLPMAIVLIAKRVRPTQGTHYMWCSVLTQLYNPSVCTEEIQALLKVLMQFHQVKQSEHLQHIYQSFLEEIQQIIPDVWSIERPAVPVMVRYIIDACVCDGICCVCSSYK